MFSSDLADIDQGVRASIASMLGRSAPDEGATKDMIFKQYIHSSCNLSFADRQCPSSPTSEYVGYT